MEEEDFSKGVTVEEVLMDQGGADQGFILMVGEDLLEDMDRRLVMATVIHIRQWDVVLRMATYESNQLQVTADALHQVRPRHREATEGSHRPGLRQHQGDMAGDRQEHLQRPVGMGGSRLLARYRRRQILADGRLLVHHQHREVMLLMDRGNHRQELKG